MARLASEFADRGTWFFGVWQPDRVRDGDTELAFADAPPDMLAQEPSCWMLAPGAVWHGFPGLEPGYCMLDPIKVTVTTPGMAPSGELTEQGIPAVLLTAYLAEHGIVAEKTANFSILFLFSIGVTKGKWGSLVNALLEFKRDYDANAPLSRAMPALVQGNPSAYGIIGLRDLASRMFTALREAKIPELLQAAYDVEPQALLTPADAYDRLVRGNGAVAGIAGLAGGIAATAIVPYPPGIPLVMPGEALGSESGPILNYLAALQAFDQQFAAFAHDTHGIEIRDGDYLGMRFSEFPAALK